MQSKEQSTGISLALLFSLSPSLGKPFHSISFPKVPNRYSTDICCVTIVHCWWVGGNMEMNIIWILSKELTVLYSESIQTYNQVMALKCWKCYNSYFGVRGNDEKKNSHFYRREEGKSLRKGSKKPLSLT